MTFAGACNRDLFEMWLEECLLPQLQPGSMIVMDNASFHRSQVIDELVAQAGCELWYLPPYSPNLNLIERFWKWVKKQCLYGRYYENFSAFQKAILNCIEQAPTQHHKELNSLLTLRFQTLSKAPPVTA